ncbi:hypothetical protein HNP33_001373 [Comamonas odontotermitis]|uniref:Lipoprotein n=1 Tax=Comamonas odontotermitis TaxID=379895 RepID=A0ABR6RDW4_9BURK|nr:hypothetical protein [Comamonas odontotermitis]MBB6577318.1 hypothetical protein [Comamonas odontotermitis]
MTRHRSSAKPLRLAAAGAFSRPRLPGGKRSCLSTSGAAPWACLGALLLCTTLSGCTVVAVGAAAVGVAADVAIGTAKLAGKGVGAAYGAMTDDKPDNSGISIKYRESDPNHPYQPGPGASNSRPPEEALP